MHNIQTAFETVRRAIIGVTLITGLASVPGIVLADPPVSMAPPLQTATSIGTQGNNPPENASPATVFNFDDVPVNQHVPVIRAVFDQGGYQLFDTVGETIVVPFINQNLYVMKFALSPNNTMYFVNDNGTPILYVPRNGYLENATVPGAKWYPFSEKFHPTTPVFLGVAPSYTEFIDTGWYPGTVLSGGYYGTRPFSSGGLFIPSGGLTFFLGGRPYNTWRDYHQYIIVHPSPYRFGYSYRPIYSNDFRPRNGQVFHGHAGSYDNHGFAENGHPFANTGHAFHGGDPRFDGKHGDDHNHGVRDGANSVIGNHPFNGSSANGHENDHDSPRFTGHSNFMDSRDRAPGPVVKRPTDNSGSKPGVRDGARNDSNRPGGNRAPGGTRAGGRYSGSSSRGGRGNP